MKRLGALVIAAALVLGAAALADAVYGDDDPADAGSNDEDDGGTLRVVCATEFEAACDQLVADLDGVATFTTESPGDTAARLAAGEGPDFDLWLVSTPWPELTGVRATTAGVTPRVGQPSGPLAQTSLDVVARDADVAAIQRACAGAQLDGRCLLGLVGTPLSESGGTTRSPTKLGLAPMTETAGVMAVGAMTNGWGFPAGFDMLDVDVNDEFRGRFSATRASATQTPNPVNRLLLVPEFNVALDTNAGAQLDAAAKGDAFESAHLDPNAIAAAVAVPAGTDKGRDALEQLGRDRVAAAIREQGWSKPTKDSDDGLPDIGVLDALITRWSTA